MKPRVSAKAPAPETTTLRRGKLSQIQYELFQDRVYTAADWEKQRGYSRIAPALLQCTCLKVLSLSPIALAVLWSIACASVVHFLFARSGDSYPEHWGNIGYAYSYISFALSLLLVFKTNTSYARWWEARKIWGRMFDWARHLTRQVCTWFPDDHELKAEIFRWIIVAPYTLRMHINVRCSSTVNIPKATLTADEYALWKEAKHRPLFISMQLSRLICRSRVSDFIALRMEDQVTLFVNNCGGCERIYKTPIPLAYTRHTVRYLMIWVTFLPLALWPSLDWVSIIVTPIIVFLLMGLENIGIQIEEPFRILPILVYCNSITDNVYEILRSAGFDLERTKGHQPPAPPAPSASEALANETSAAAPVSDFPGDPGAEWRINRVFIPPSSLNPPQSRVVSNNNTYNDF
mmetsp:Transcript_36209/g.61062  ORF Transcript_36209/g.61062 Transcript_36209/m.61062 type:complete len:405 (+) Transcript_36209:242-1456(+)